MHAVLRRYPSGSPVHDAVMQRSGEVEALLRGVPGFVAYYSVQLAVGSVTVTICEDQAGTQESTRRAAAWVRENVPQATGRAPEVMEGEVGLHFSR